MARPRDPDVDARILEAARRLMREMASEQVTVEAIAELAGVSRPTVYRRWHSRSALLFEAQTNASVTRPFPDLGSARAELVAAMNHLARTMAAADRTLVGGQFGEMIANQGFAANVWTQRWTPDREIVYELWRRGVERGDLDPDVDGNEVIDDLVAICAFRILLGHRTLSAGDVEDIVDRILDGVARVRSG